MAHSSVVDENRFDYRRLRQVLGLESLIDIHIGMVRPRFIVQRILDELERGNTDGIEGFVIGTTGIAQADG